MPTSHTSGPWHVSPPTAYGWDIRSADGKWVALVNNDHDNPDGFPTNEEGKANAYRMAASPDLLEACKFALGHLEVESEMNHQRGIGPSFRAEIETLRSAIAKAEGSPNAR